jgi:ABC-2 type transport system permease protein
LTETVSAPSTLVRESLLFAGRLLTRWRRQPAVPIQSLLFPTVLLITYHFLAGESMTRITGAATLDVLVPTCAVAGAMFGALGTGFALPEERDTGLLSRFWTFPLHRASALTGRVVAEAARTLVGSALITAVGIALGLRFHGGWLAVVPFLLVSVLVTAVFSLVVATVGLRSEGNCMFIWLGSASTGLVFCNAGLAPVEKFPPWLQPLIQFQPMSPVIESMRALARGDAAFWPLLQTFGWALGLAVFVVPLAVHGYRAAAESG